MKTHLKYIKGRGLILTTSIDTNLKGLAKVGLMIDRRKL